MNRILHLSAIALIGLAALGMSSGARAQALPVDVDITIDDGGVAILNYYEALDVSISPEDLATIQAVPTDCTTINGTQQCKVPAPGLKSASVGSGGSGDSELVADGALLLAIPDASLRNVRLDIDNVWAVRAIGGLAVSTTVTILPGTATTLTNSTVGVSGTITIGNAKGYIMGAGGVASSIITFPDPGLDFPTYGGVQLTLDMSNATNAGVYTTVAGSDVDPNFTIEITGT